MKTSPFANIRILNPVVACCLCMALTIGATYFAMKSSNAENAGRFERSVVTFVGTLRNRMNVYTNAIIYTRNLFDIEPGLTQEEFEKFVSGMRLRENFPGIQTMGYVERMPVEAAKAYLAKHGKTLADAGTHPDAVEVDLVTRFQQLLDSKTTVLHLDLASNAERKTAMNRARDLGVHVATNRVTPIHATDPDLYAFLVFVPRYKQGVDLSTIENRQKALLGFVYGGFRAGNLFGRVSDDARLRNLDLSVRIYDGDKVDESKLMFTEGDFSEIDPNLVRTVEFQAANHTWTVEIAAPRGYELVYLKWSPYFVLALGTLLSLAVTISMWRQSRLTKSLELAREESENANRAKSVFLANISHEIRTPLGIITGFAESALAEENANQREQFLKTILRNGRELTRIIGDVLDLSKIEANTLLIEKRTFSLKELHRDLVEMWTPLARNKGLTFTFEEIQLCPEFVISDETRIKQILVNLLSNALKFTEKGNVTVSVECRRENDGNQALIYSVSDTGIGIEVENRAKLFRAFSQGDSSITRKFGGSGLGLALSRELAQALGGNISLDSNAGSVGSRFVFKVPIEVTAAVAKRPACSDVVETLKGRKVLLVEDSIDNQRLVQLLLKKSQVFLEFANNGKEGIDKAMSERFDLVLMDIQMPVMDGYKAFAELRSKNFDTPVIALTAHAMKEERERALELGFAAYLTKPIDRAQLVDVMSKTIDASLPV